MDRKPMTEECKRIAELIQLGELKVRPGKWTPPQHLSFGIMWVKLPDYVVHDGKRYWVSPID